MDSEKEGSIFMLELRECSKRIYDIPKFIFYALGYAIRRVLTGTRSGIKGFLLKKEQPQQLTLAQCFGIGAFGGLGFRKWGKSKNRNPLHFFIKDITINIVFADNITLAVKY